MKKLIYCPLLVAIATMSLHANAQQTEASSETKSAPAEQTATANPETAIIDLPSAIDPANVDDQKLKEMLDLIRASRTAAINTLGDRTLIAAGVTAGTAAAAGVTGEVSKGVLLKAASSRKFMNSKAFHYLKRIPRGAFRIGGLLVPVAFLYLNAGIFIKTDELLTSLPVNTKDQALINQSGADLDTLLKHSNQEIVAMAAKDAALKKQLVNIYQAIMFINQPAAN